jgi:hypothetical protein
MYIRYVVVPYIQPDCRSTHAGSAVRSPTRRVAKSAVADQPDVRPIALALPDTSEADDISQFSAYDKGKRKGFVWAWNERAAPEFSGWTPWRFELPMSSRNRHSWPPTSRSFSPNVTTVSLPFWPPGIESVVGPLDSVLVWPGSLSDSDAVADLG